MDTIQYTMHTGHAARSIREVCTVLMRGILLAAGLLALLLLPSLANADDAPHIRAKAGAAMRSEFDNSGGSFQANYYGFDASWKWFYLDYTTTVYDWKDTKDMRFSGGKKPWNDLSLLRIGARVNGPTTMEGLGWFFDGGLVGGWEDDMSSSFGFAGSAGMTWQFSPNLTGKLGLWTMVHPALFRFLPVASLDWNVPQDLGFSATFGFPETMLRFRTEQGITLRAGAKVDMGDRAYRLDNDSHVYRKGYISTTGVTTGVYVDVSPLEGLTASVGLEYDVDRKYEIRSSHGNKKQTLDVESTPSLQFNLGYRF